MKVGRFHVYFKSVQNTKSQSNLLPFQRSKFQNLRRLNDNGGDKLAYTISCFRKIISQCFNLKCDSV